MGITLRDIRRVVGRAGSVSAINHHPAIRPAIWVDPALKSIKGWVAFSGSIREYYNPAYPQAIDRAISLLGPDYDLEAYYDYEQTTRSSDEERKKETEVVDGASQSGDQAHGGDSSSGEVPDEKSQRGQWEPSAQAAGTDSSTEEATGAGSADDDCATPGLSELSLGTGEVTEGAGDPQADPMRPISDTPQCDAADAAGEVGSDEGSANIRYELGAAGEAASTRPNQAYGGVYATWDEAEKSRVRGRAAKDVVRALRRLFASWMGGTDESPRLDGRRLIREMVSRRYRLSRTYRREKGEGTILLMADVSGSCSAAAPRTVEACRQVAMELDSVVVVIHSNGYPQEVVDATGRVSSFGLEEDGLQWWEYYILSRHLIGAVNFGDWDAGWILRRISARCPLVWLDSFAAKDGPKPVPKYGTLWFRMRWDVPPAVWWQGVNDTVSAAIALRAAAKKQEGGKR